MTEHGDVPLNLATLPIAARVGLCYIKLGPAPTETGPVGSVYESDSEYRAHVDTTCA
jgi:hypothetical protein